MALAAWGGRLGEQRPPTAFGAGAGSAVAGEEERSEGLHLLERGARGLAFDDERPEVEFPGPGRVRVRARVLPGREWPGEGQEGEDKQAAHRGRRKKGAEGSESTNGRQAANPMSHEGKAAAARSSARAGPVRVESRCARSGWSGNPCVMALPRPAVAASGRKEAVCA